MTRVEAKPYVSTPEFRRDRLAHAVFQRTVVERDYAEIRNTYDPTIDPVIIIEHEYREAVNTITIGIISLVKDIVDTGNPSEIVPMRETIGMLGQYIGIPQKNRPTVK